MQPSQNQLRAVVINLNWMKNVEIECCGLQHIISAIGCLQI